MSINMKAAAAELDELRKELPIPYVMEVYGHHPTSEGAGRLHYYNPFREDEHPSFDVFVNKAGEQRWGDFAEGTQGGVIDLIQRFTGESTRDAVVSSRNLYSDFLRGDWNGPVLEAAARAHADPRELHDRLESASERIADVTGPLREARPGIPGDEILTSRWHVRRDGDVLVIPYFDELSACALRFRDTEGNKWFFKGSRMVPYSAPYEGQGKVLLVEGESDAWATDASLGGEYWVVSLPGVGHRPENILGDLLGNLPVFIGFDPDKAGREAAKTYGSYLMSRGNEVFYVPLPGGSDWASLPASIHREVVERGRPILAPPDDFVAGPEGYLIQLASGNTRKVSNFTISPEKVYRSESGAYWYRVQFNPGHETVTLPETAIASQKALQSWANQYRRSWMGGNLDHTKLSALLQYEATFLPEGKHTTRPGLVQSTFVWPGHKIGPDDVVWVDSERVPGLPKMFRPPTQADAEVVEALVKAYSIDVMAPMLGWLALAPLRSKYHRFPILFITGRSGSGKTSLTSSVLRVFTGTEMTTNLTSTTPYGVQTYYALSNAFPVWFDEYRPGANKNALSVLNQLMRDGYTGQPSVRGGMTADLSKVTALQTDSPIIVTGEDVADETSHRERMVRLYLDPKQRGYLGTLEDSQASLLWDYLHFLTGHNAAGRNYVEQPPEVEPYGPTSLNDRQRWNLGIIREGYDLFRVFVEDYYRYFDLPEADWTQVIDGAVEDTATDQVIDILAHLYEQSETQAVWEYDGQVCVSAGKVIECVERVPSLVLPMSSSKALTHYLVANFDGVVDRAYNPVTRKQVRVIRLPLSVVDVDGSMGV
jgi:hypothetical protein